MSAAGKNVAEPNLETMDPRGETETPVKSSPLKVPLVTPTEPVDPLESFNTRIRQSTHKQLKVYCALNGIKIQDVVNEAIRAYVMKKE